LFADCEIISALPRILSRNFSSLYEAVCDFLG
jgi:hypothetical protein